MSSGGTGSHNASSFHGTADEVAISEFKRGNTDYIQKNYESALSHYNKAIALANFTSKSNKNKQGNDLQVNLVLSLLVNRAITQLHLKEFQQSIDDCTTAIKIDSTYLKPYICRAFGHYHIGSYELAIEDFETCFKIQPYPYNNYNTTLLHNLQKAKEELSQLSEQKRREAAAKYILSKGQSHFASLLHLLSIDYDIHHFEQPNSGINANDTSSIPLDSMDDFIISASSPSETAPSHSSQSKAPSSKSTTQPPLKKAASTTQASPKVPTSSSSSGGTGFPGIIGSNGPATPNPPNDAGLPLLIPVGEVISKDCIQVDTPISSIADTLANIQASTLLEYPKKESEELALKEKELGNKAFEEGMFAEALLHYSKAIKLNWREAVFFSNRALVYLKLNRYYESISDCTAAIDRKPPIKVCVKAYARRGAAWVALKEFFLAAEDYKKALKLQPRNLECLPELEKCLHYLERDYSIKLQTDSNNEKLKKSLFNVREDLRKIASILNEATGPSSTSPSGSAQNSPTKIK